MISRPHICLRCQLRLARPTPSRIQAALQSTSAHQPNHPSQSPGAHGEQDEAIKQPYIRPEYLHQTDLSHRPLRTQYAAQNLHGQHGKKLREDRERLDIDALGRPTDVIVLRDSKLRTYNHVDIVEQDEKPHSIDILATLDCERGLPGQQEVTENINQFRPKEGEWPQDRDSFHSLLTDIQTSFTASQLASYIKSFKKSHGGDLSTPWDHQLIPSISPWVAETSQPTPLLEDKYTRGYFLASYTNKQRLAFRILRECWKVELPELDTGVGAVELELKPKDYELLIRSSRPILGIIAAKHIDAEAERIDGFRSKHTIRITTTRRKSGLIINEIEQALRNIRQEEIYLGDLMQSGKSRSQIWKWVEKQFNSTVIKYISDTTNTEIDMLPKKRLRISCIDMNPESEKGNRLDIALRLLVTSGDASNRISNWLGRRETDKASSGVFMMYTAIDGLGWRDRLRQWTRWTAPIAKKSDEQDGPRRSDVTLGESAKGGTLSPTNNDKQETVEVTQQKVTKAMEQNPTSQTEAATILNGEYEGSTHWQDVYRVESTAIIGSVLHSYDDPSKVSTVAPKPTGNTSKSDMHRAFSTVVPNLSRLIGSSSTWGLRRSSHKTLIMHFQPNPFFKSPETSQPIGAAALSAFPPLEMRFSVDEDTNAYKFRDIQAVHSVRNSDLMLPESVSDVRFQQRSVSALHVRPEHYPPGLAEFLSKCSLDIEQGHFGGPPRLTLPVAAHLCQDPGFKLLGAGVAGDDMHDVEYLFTQLDIRKMVMMSWEGWRLHYTSIEAGKAGGRRGELRLLPVKIGRYNDTPATEEEFLEAACRLADGVERGDHAALVARRVHKPKITNKVWADGGGRILGTHEIPQFFTRKLDIRDAPAQEFDIHEANMQRLSENLAQGQQMKPTTGQEGDEHEFT